MVRFIFVFIVMLFIVVCEDVVKDSVITNNKVGIKYQIDKNCKPVNIAMDSQMGLRGYILFDCPNEFTILHIDGFAHENIVIKKIDNNNKEEEKNK